MGIGVVGVYSAVDCDNTEECDEMCRGCRRGSVLRKESLPQVPVNSNQNMRADRATVVLLFSIE